MSRSKKVSGSGILLSILAGWLAAGSTVLHADTLRVPHDYPTIQRALDAAQPGDEVVVADGVYTGPENKNLDFGGKAMTLRSENGPENSIIDCEQDGRAAHFRFGEQGVELVALTLRNGLPGVADASRGSGGAVLCGPGSEVTLRDCRLTDNRSVAQGPDFAGGSGGGVWCEAGSRLTLIGCYFARNLATNPLAAGRGAAAGSAGADLRAVACTFEDNSLDSYRGYAIQCSDGGSVDIAECVVRNNLHCGISVSGVAASIRRCDIIGNVGPTEVAGFGIHAIGPDVTIERCSIVGNGNPGGMTWGGGAALAGGVVIQDCLIKGNRASFGVGISAGAGDVTILDCVIIANGAGQSAGGVHGDGSGLVIRNCTITANLPGGLSTSSSIRYGVVNSVVRGNLLWEVSSGAQVSYSNVMGGWPGQGNIDAAPLFVDPASGNFRLQPGSPCIDTGDPSFAFNPGDTDLGGLRRLWDGDGNGKQTVDMGAHEFGSAAYGDLNCDGALDAFDIGGFVLAVFDPAGYAAQYPDCEADLADLNFDGAIDAFDIEPFIDLLFGP